MSHSTAWAKRLIRELPKDPAALLKRSSYWDPVFLALYFDHVDEMLFHDPRVAMKWAAISPRLALLVDPHPGPAAQQKHRDMVTAGYALLGSAHRAVGEYAASEAAYRTGARLAKAGISALAWADFSQRLARLRVLQRRTDEALRLATEAVETFRSKASKKLGEALVIQGYILAQERRFSDALLSFGEALEITDPKDSAAATRIHHCAIHNIAYVISQAPRNVKDLYGALAHVREARQLLKGHRRSVPRYKLHWVDGLIFARLGFHARAERVLDSALGGFRDLGLPLETALVSLDRGALYHFFGEWRQLEVLAMETFQRFRILAENTKAITALSLWVDAVKARTLTEAITTRARREIEFRLAPDGCYKPRDKSAI